MTVSSLINTSMINVVAFTEAGEEPLEVINPVVPNIYDIFWAAVFFGALFALFKFVLLPPVVKTMEDRENKLRAERAKADEARSQLASAQADYDNALAEARADGAAIVDSARSEGETYRSEVVGAAQAEVNQAKEAAAMAATASHDQAAGQLNSQVSTIAIGAAEKVIGKRLDPAAQRPVLDRVLSQASKAAPAAIDTPDLPGGNQ